MPPSSLYCTQKSVSRISAAAANLSRAASPLLSLPLCSSGPLSAKSSELLVSSAAPTAAVPAVPSPFFMNERRLTELRTPFKASFIMSLLRVFRSCTQTRDRKRHERQSESSRDNVADVSTAKLSYVIYLLEKCHESSWPQLSVSMTCSCQCP